MKWWMWASLGAGLVVAVLLFIGKDDFMQFQRMHRM
jgi:hypothetical protein